MRRFWDADIQCLLQVPKRVSNVPAEILQPSSQWKDGAEFDKALRHLASLYTSNFKKCANQHLCLGTCRSLAGC